MPEPCGTGYDTVAHAVGSVALVLGWLYACAKIAAWASGGFRWRPEYHAQPWWECPECGGVIFNCRYTHL